MTDIKKILDSVKMEGNIPAYNIYGDITSSPYDSWEGDTCPVFIKNFIENNKGREIHIHINSPGGNVFSGIAIYNMIKAREGKTVVYIDALAASAASVIALAGDEIYMPRGAMLMVHEPWTICTGNAGELRKQADSLDKICESITDIYSSASGYDRNYINELLKAETWLTAEESAAMFERVLIDESLMACACARGDSLKWYDSVPMELTFAKDKDCDTTNAEVKMLKDIEAKIVEIEVEEMLLSD